MSSITIFDVGGGGGVHRSWSHFPSPFRYYSFDPNPAQIAELVDQSQQVAPGSQNKYFIVNKAVTSKDEVRTVNIFDHRFDGSLFRHNPDGCYRFKKLSLVSQIEVNCTSVDTLCKNESIVPDFLTIDAEGSTFEILSGAARTLREHVLGVRVELELSPLYQGAPRFYENVKLLDNAGYRLTRLETCNSGFFGVSSDMNSYSVSPSDALPFTTDAIFVNTELIHRQLKTALDDTFLYKLVNTIAFCIHNGCGYYGIDLLDLLRERHPLAALSTSDKTKAAIQLLCEEIALYFSIERRGLNRNFNASKEFFSLTGRDISDFLPGRPHERDKIQHIYDEDRLYQEWINPKGYNATVKFF